MAPIYSLKERRPRADRAPSISIAFQDEKIVRAMQAVAHRGRHRPGRPQLGRERLAAARYRVQRK